MKITPKERECILVDAAARYLRGEITLEEHTAIRDAHKLDYRDDLSDYVWIAPCRKGGQACVGGTRLPVANVAGYLWAGDTVEHIAKEFRITPAQVLAAAWYQATYGPRSWRKRWGTWAKVAFPYLWHRERYDECPSPPSVLS